MEISTFSEYDLYLYHQGTNYHSYQIFGAHFTEILGKKGVKFTVWAPHAQFVSVVGSFNDWQCNQHPMHRQEDGSVWSIFICLLYTSDAADE